MKLMVLTAAVFPSEAEARAKLWIFLASCKKFGIEPHLYGMGHGFPGYKHMKLDMQLEYLKEHRNEDYTHVLYHDGWDGMFTGPLSEILHKYKAMGSPPMLSSASPQLGNVSERDKDYPGCFDLSLRYAYPCVGGYLAEYAHIIEMFERMLALPRQTGDDCFNWYDGWKEGWFRPMLDHACEIFQVTDDHCAVEIGHPTIVDGHVQYDVWRLVNNYTGSTPCLWHLSGGYTDQVTGKDHVMVPWAKKLGILHDCQPSDMYEPCRCCGYHCRVCDQRWQGYWDGAWHVDPRSHNQLDCGVI